MDRGDDGDDWKARFIPGHRATPLSIKMLLGFTVFVVQTAIGLVATENLSFFLNRPTLTTVGVTRLVVPLLLWMAMDLGRGIERERLNEQKDAQHPGRSLTDRQRTEVENICLRLLQETGQSHTSDAIVATILDSHTDPDDSLDELGLTDPELRERLREQRRKNQEDAPQTQRYEADQREHESEK